MKDDLSRYDDWLAWLRETAAADDEVRLVWVGGSAATGGFDRWSDLDVEVQCRPGTSLAVHARWMRAIHERFAPADVWEVPPGTWPDGTQVFVSMRPDPGALTQPTRLVDLRVWDLSHDRTRVDPRRHGRVHLLHDPDGWFTAALDDGRAMAHRMCDALDQDRQRRVTGGWLVARAEERGAHAEATELYLRFALAPVVRALRVELAPWRHDYGLRYLTTDLGESVAGHVEALVPGRLEGRSPTPLAEGERRCRAWLDQLLDRPGEGPLFPVWAEPGRVWAAADTGADPARVWAALTTGPGLAAWLGRLDGEVASGSSYRIDHGGSVTGGGSATDRVSEHRVLTCEPGERLVTTWAFPGEHAYGLVEWRISPSGRLDLEHREPDGAASYAAGWRRHLQYLLASLAGAPLPWGRFWDGVEERAAQEERRLAAQQAMVDGPP